MQQQQEQEENSDVYSSSEELMPQAFNMDCEDSDAQEAVAYLRSVRQQAQNAPAYTECKEAVNTREVDAQYKQQPKLCGQITLDMTVWEQEAIQYFRSVRQNIQGAKDWRKQVGDQQYLESLQNLDQELESNLEKVCKSRDKFQKNMRRKDAILPTLNFMTNVDFLTAYNLYEWLAQDIPKIKELTYAQCFWSYCLLSLLEPPVDADCTANINILLTKAMDNQKYQEEIYNKLDDFSKQQIQKTMGMLSTIIAVIKFDFRQFFIQ